MEHPTTSVPLPIRTSQRRRSLFDLRRPSLLRGSLLVLLSLPASILLSHFPNNHATLLLILPVVTAVIGTADTLRCLQRRWSFYHAGVILLIYMDLMAVSMIIFFFLYPYLHWLSPTH